MRAIMGGSGPIVKVPGADHDATARLDDTGRGAQTLSVEIRIDQIFLLPELRVCGEAPPERERC